MVVSSNINLYIESSKINGRLCKWKKSVVNIFITPISATIGNKEFYYSEIRRGAQIWNEVFRQIWLNLCFNFVQSAASADIIIHWTKVGRVQEGMCKYLSIVNGELKKVSIEVGLENKLSPKNTTADSIFFVIMHEFGHSLGLGHGIDIDDVMYVPHQKNIHKPSEDDLFVLKKIYFNS